MCDGSRECEKFATERARNAELTKELRQQQFAIDELKLLLAAGKSEQQAIEDLATKVAEKRVECHDLRNQITVHDTQRQLCERVLEGLAPLVEEAKERHALNPSPIVTAALRVLPTFDLLIKRIQKDREERRREKEERVSQVVPVSEVRKERVA